MGSNRVLPVSATISKQTHTPSGPSSLPVVDASLIKTELTAPMDAAMTHCHSENWAESYQDLSSWCSATSASSLATCQSPVIDEGVVADIEFQGEIDFDLRKSEQIASIPLEEDNSFNLWGAGSGVSTSPPPSVSAETIVERPDSVLLKDCWWSEVEQGGAVTELDSNRPQVLPIKSHHNYNSTTTVAVKNEAVDAKENMNPLVMPHLFLADPAKMAELQRRCERIASLSQPGGSNKAKGADLMKIVQEQIAALNKKRYRSPAAVSDLHNYSKIEAAQYMPSTSTVESHPVQTAAPVMSGAPGDIFQSDPFEGLFTVSDHMQAGVQFQAPAVSTGSHQQFPEVVTAPTSGADLYHSNSAGPLGLGSTTTGVVGRGSDLFFEAHHEIMRGASKPQHLLNQPKLLLNQQQIAAPSQSFLATNQMLNAPGVGIPRHAAPTKNGLTIQLPPPRLPEMDLSFENLFGSPGVLPGVNKVQAMSTPEVLKPLVETPDPESFDLVSYLFDDKLNTPPVSLDNNPFHFPQPASSFSTPSTSTSVPELKPNVMVVKPLTPQWPKKNVETSEEASEDPAVVVEVKPQLMPSALSDVEEENEQDEFSGEVQVVAKKSLAEKEMQISPRPSRISRKRKYSEEEFELSPSTNEEKPRSSKGKRRNSSKYDSDEEFTLPVRKSRKKSVSVTEDEEEVVKAKRPRAASTAKRGERTASTSSESDRYRELRDRNNEASRKSRLTRKAREQELSKQAEVLTKENRVLKVKVDEMESLVKKLREALLHSMMNKKSDVA